MSESYTILALLSKGFCRLGGMKWFAFSEFRWRLLGTYIKSAIILKIFFISPQVMLSPFASDTSLWPKYFCRSYCWALLCFRGRPLVLLHGDGRCFACGTGESYFLSWGRLKILITDYHLNSANNIWPTLAFSAKGFSCSYKLTE